MKRKNTATAANKESDQPVNILNLNPQSLSKLKRVKEGELFSEDDLLLIIDDQYAKIASESPLHKKKITKDNIVYRKR